ncbi:MAG: L-histidine N(alpha)-methyltransferase [archaeon]
MSATQINDLIFKELIKRGYSLDGNTRVWNIADSKLWYLTPKQAQAYLDLLDSETYKSDFGPKEMTLIGKNLGKILKMVGKGSLNIVDLGCGDGRKVVLFLDNLKGKQKIRYCPIDISGYLVEKALERISQMAVDDVIKFKWNISDFENLENVTPLLRWGDYKKSLFLLLGNTLGNFEFHELLYQIRDSMSPGDYLLIGNGIDNGLVDEDVVAFLKKSNPFYEFFVKVLTEIGLEKKELEFDIRFRNSRIEYAFVLKKDAKIVFQDKKVDLFEGDQIIVGYTYHFSKEELKRYLKIYFDKVEMIMSGDGSYTLALCKVGEPFGFGRILKGKAK